MNIYYEDDQVVEEDQELQDFVKDVYVYGMRGRKASGRLPRFSVSVAGPMHLEKQEAGDGLQRHPPT